MFMFWVVVVTGKLTLFFHCPVGQDLKPDNTGRLFKFHTIESIATYRVHNNKASMVLLTLVALMDRPLNI